MNLDIIVLIIVVALIFQRLWRVLGTRPETETKKVRLSRESAEKLYNILKSEAEKDFKIDARGYRPQEVDQFLDMVIKDYVDTENTIRKLIAEIKSLEAENTKLRSEVRNLKTSLDIAGSNKVTNVDLLKRISDLEKVVYGE